MTYRTRTFNTDKSVIDWRVGKKFGVPVSRIPKKEQEHLRKPWRSTNGECGRLAVGRPKGAPRCLIQASAMLVALSRPSRPDSTSKVTF